MKNLLLTIFLLFLLSCLYGQEKTSYSQNNDCSNLCGRNEACLCDCFFKKGQELRQSEKYSDALKQLQVAVRLCDNKQAQAIIDTIQYQEQRFWIYEGGVNGKFAIANGLGELVEKDKPYNPYRFSNPEQFRKGIAMYSTNEIYYFVDRMGNVLTPINGYRGIIQSEGDINYFISGEEVDYKHGININNGLHPVLWRNSYMVGETLQFYEMSPWKKLDSLKVFLQKIQNQYSYVGEFINGLSWAKNKSRGWVLINQYNNEISNQMIDYDEMKSFNSNIAFYRKGDKWGIYNILDNKAHELLYDDVEVFQCNNTNGYLDGKWVTIDTLGQQIDNCDPVNNSLNTMAWASPSYKKWVLFNSRAEIINEYNIENITPCLMSKETSLFIANSVLPLPKYDYIWWYNDGFAWVVKDGKYGLIDSRGEEKLSCIYSFESVRGVENGLAWVKSNGKEGYIDTLGRQVIPCEYDNIGDFDNGIAHITKNKKRGMIDIFGNEIVKPIYEWVGYFTDSVVWVEDDSMKWGLISINEKKLTPSIFDSVRGFVNGKAWVNLEGKWGLLNRENYTIYFPPIKLDVISVLQDGSCWGRIDDKFGLFDAVGNIIFMIDKNVESLMPTHNNDLAIIKCDDKCELIYKNGKVITSNKYDYIYNFESGLAKVELGNMRGLIDTLGKEILTPKYDVIYSFQKGLAEAGINEKWDLINTNGAVISKERYDMIREIHDNVVVVEKNSKVGLIDRGGKELLPCVYDKYDFRAENIILFYQNIFTNTKMGLFFVDSLTWIPAEYEEITRIHDEWVMVMKNGMWGWVDRKGNVMIPCRYYSATPFNDEGYATVYQFGLQFQINKKGEMIWRN